MHKYAEIITLVSEENVANNSYFILNIERIYLGQKHYNFPALLVWKWKYLLTFYGD